LALIIIAKLGRIGPWLVAFLRVVPRACEGVLGLGSTKQWAWSAIPFGICSGLDLHVGIHCAGHVCLARRALIVLVALSKLATSIRQRIFAIDKIPRVLVACIILDCLLHGLSEERCNIDKAILIAVGTVISHEKELVCNPIIVHHTQTIKKILIAVDR